MMITRSIFNISSVTQLHHNTLQSEDLFIEMQLTLQA